MLKLTFLGHSCFLLNSPTTSLILDPWLRDNPQCSIKPEDIEVNALLITHGHFDHLGDAIEISKRTNAVIIAPAELANYCAQLGATTHRMHIGGSHDFGNYWIKLTPAWHGSSILNQNNYYTGMPCGFLIKMENKIIYHAGDTGLFSDMKYVLGDRYPIDIALLPIGDNVVMGPEDALTAVEWLKPKTVIPMHYNTFPLIKQNPESFKAKVENLGVDCIILQPGDELSL